MVDVTVYLMVLVNNLSFLDAMLYFLKKVTSHTQVENTNNVTLRD